MTDLIARAEKAEAQVARMSAPDTASVAALADDEELMWRMAVREYDIVGKVSDSLRAEVIRQSREHVLNLAAALDGDA